MAIEGLDGRRLELKDMVLAGTLYRYYVANTISQEQTSGFANNQRTLESSESIV